MTKGSYSDLNAINLAGKLVNGLGSPRFVSVNCLENKENYASPQLLLNHKFSQN